MVTFSKCTNSRKQELQDTLYHCFNFPTHIPYALICDFECLLLVIVENPSITVHNGYAMAVCRFAHTVVHAVVRPVVPLAVKHEELIYTKVCVL